MANPYFTNSEVFGDPNRKHHKPNYGPRTPHADTSAYFKYGYAGGQAGTATLERPGSDLGVEVDPGAGAAAVVAPAGFAVGSAGVGAGGLAASAVDRPLTYDDVIVKTGGLLALLVAVAATTFVLAPGLWPVGMIGGLILGLVNSFRREPSPVLVTLYTAFQGVFLGGVSFAFTAVGIDGVPVSGLITQAVLATFVTVAVTLALYRSGKVRVTGRFRRFISIALISFLAFQLINLALVFTGVVAGAGARGGGLGILVSLVAIGLAAGTLIVDFDSIRRGVEAGVSQRYAWAAAFGLMVTLVWLYLEFIRLFALLNQRR